MPIKRKRNYVTRRQLQLMKATRLCRAQVGKVTIIRDALSKVAVRLTQCRYVIEMRIHDTFPNLKIETMLFFIFLIFLKIRYSFKLKINITIECRIV